MANTVNTIDYITISSLGNAADFGDLTVARAHGAACSSGSRGVTFGGSDNGPTKLNVIDYWTFASLSNASDFGDLISARHNNRGAVSEGTKGVVAGGVVGGVTIFTDAIDYVTIASLGNASDFGDLTLGRSYIQGVSDGTKGVWVAGVVAPWSSDDTMDYNVIASLGNSSDFGDLTSSIRGVMAASGD